MSRKTRPSFERSKSIKNSKDSICVLCEGKTESFYIESVRVDFGLKNWTIRKAKYSTAINMVEQAHQLKGNNDFETIYCVFDGDVDCDEALELAKDCGIIYFESVSCFEYWLLLHFEDTTAQHSSKRMVSELKKHIPLYEKPQRNSYELTKEKLPVARVRADRNIKNLQAAGTDEPRTRVQKLIKLMQDDV